LIRCSGRCVVAPGSIHDPGGYIEPLRGFSEEYVDSFTKASTPDGVGHHEISDGPSGVSGATGASGAT
jgi:hypothetical protein